MFVSSHGLYVLKSFEQSTNRKTLQLPKKRTKPIRIIHSNMESTLSLMEMHDPTSSIESFERILFFKTVQ